MQVRHIFIGTGLLLFSVLCWAEDDIPDAELLEFLGSFETSDDQWFDPMLLDEIEILDETLSERQSDERK